MAGGSIYVGMYSNGGVSTGDMTKSVYSKQMYLDGQNQLSSQQIIEFQAVYSGYLVGMSVVVENQRTDGTIDFKITKNGLPLTPTELNIQINGSYPSSRISNVPYGIGGYDIEAGDSIGIEVTTNDFAPLNNNINVDVIIEKKQS